jgi:cyclopropane fatty-acyl-phospholipid synthase-like methyltransferase
MSSRARSFSMIVRSVLDAGGCGTGENALHFNRARRKAAERGLSATFLVSDALTLKDWTERFDNVIDSGLFHIFGHGDKPRYIEGLAADLKPGGRVFLLCFSEEEARMQGPKKELYDAFSKGEMARR